MGGHSHEGWRRRVVPPAHTVALSELQFGSIGAIAGRFSTAMTMDRPASVGCSVSGARGPSAPPRTRFPDPLPAAAFDRLTALAATCLAAPIALVMLAESDGECLVRAHGLQDGWAGGREAPLADFLCRHVITNGQALTLDDVSTFPLVRETLGADALTPIAFAGVPLTTSDGEIVGAFCVIDEQLRRWTDADVQILTGLAAAVITEMDLRCETGARRRAQEALQSVSLGIAAPASIEEFLASLVKLLASALNVRFTFVGLARPDLSGYMASLASWVDGAPANTMDYELAGTPCERVMLDGPQYYPANVQALFPNDPPLAELGVESYMGTPIRNATGEALGVVAALHDGPIEDATTAQAIMAIVAARAGAELQRLRAENAFRQSGAVSAAILAASLDCVITIDGMGRVVEFNSAAEQTFGHRRDDVIGREMAEVIIPPSLRDAHRRGLERYVTHGTGTIMGKRIEVMAMRADGSEFPAELTITRLPLDGPVRFTGFLRDLSERQRVQEWYRALIENASDATVVLDDRGRITYASPAVIRLLGQFPEQIVGRNVIRLVHREDRARAREALANAIAHPDINIVSELRYRHGDEWRTLAGTGRNLLAHSAVGGIVVNLRDVTDQKLLGEQLRQAQRLEVVGQLAGGIAHDFNNLVTVINVNGEMLAESLDGGDPNRCHVEEIMMAANRAAGLTRQLLAFSRRQLLQPKVLVLDRVIESMVPLLRRLIGEDIELSLLSGCADAHVSADAGQLEQVFVNLVVNARDAMPQGGRLTVETNLVNLNGRAMSRPPGVAPGTYVGLTICDNGVGMSAGVLKRIFEPFFTTKEQGRGTGLGLATVYGIVSQSGGHVWADSIEGRGTTFTIYFPQVPAPIEPEVNLRSTRPTPRGNETVLVVEDEASVRTLAIRVLSRQGYNVLEARSPSEALTIADEYAGSIDLLLTDVVMPGMNGRDLAERLVKVRPETRVVFMSGYTDDDIIRRGVLDLTAAFVQKPFTVDSLSRAIRETIDAVGTR
jgi:PAS domain S-box-containing protein